MKNPVFEEVVVESQQRDGYWIQAVDVNGDGRPDLVASGLTEGELVWYENPGWRKHQIATLDKPVSVDSFDLTGDGYPDLLVSHDYGECMFNCKPQDGKVSWLRNPGRFTDDQPWEQRPVGDLIAAHRHSLGNFTQSDRVELLALPSNGPQLGREGIHGPVRVTLYDVPSGPDLLDVAGWKEQVVDDSYFAVSHAAWTGRFPDSPRPDLDSLLIANERGITWLGVDETGSWRTQQIGEGETGQPEKGGYQWRGSGNLTVGSIGGDPHACIVAAEPWHGNTIVAYTKPAGSTGVLGATWNRTVLDVFGDPNGRGEGPSHHIVAADFDGDGDDEFLVTLRGPVPWQGVFYYKVIDAANGQFVRKRVSSTSAARIAIADFDGDGRLDFATTSYYVPGYFFSDNPQIKVFLNRFGEPGGALVPRING